MNVLEGSTPEGPDSTSIKPKQEGLHTLTDGDILFDLEESKALDNFLSVIWRRTKIRDCHLCSS